MVALRGGAVAYERGTPVDSTVRTEVFWQIYNMYYLKQSVLKVVLQRSIHA